MFSRYVVGYKISNSLSVDFCLDMLDDATINVIPNIINTDQGSQFTCNEWLNMVLERNIKISMDGKGRWADNIFIERFWRTIKYEEIFINPPADGKELKEKY